MSQKPFHLLFAEIVERYGARKVQSVCYYASRGTITEICQGKSLMGLERAAALSRYLAARGDNTLRDWFGTSGPQRRIETNGTLADERLLLEDLGTFAERAIQSGEVQRMRRLRDQYREALELVNAELDDAIKRAERGKKQRSLI